MDTTLRRGLVAELLGTFAVVYFGAGVVCANYMTSTGSPVSLSPVHAFQPGLVGVALAQGCIFAAALAVTVRLSGGFLNPAITLMLWVFNRLDSKRTALFLAAQIIGALAAGACLGCTFDDSVLRSARFGTPHLNLAAFERVKTGSILAGTSIELILTFFLVFAIFAANGDGADRSFVGLPAGLVLVAGGLLAGPLTGGAANPARWLGTVVWEQLIPDHPNPWGDTFVFLAGPILGALAGGLVSFRMLFADSQGSATAKDKVAPPAAKPSASAIRKK